MKVKVGSLRGRPAKPPADLAQVEVIASLGLTDTEIAIILGISERTLNYWKKNPEFLQSIKRGKIKADFKVNQSLYHKAIGHKAVDKDGNQIDVPGETAAMIFWLKNRQPDRWRDKQAGESSDKPIYYKIVYDENPTPPSGEGTQ